MAFNIQTFADNLATHGTIQTNKFEVRIFSRLVGLQSVTVDAIKDINQLDSAERESFDLGYNISKDRIDSVRLPGLMIDTYETRRYGVGPNIKTGTNVRFDPFSISIINDKDFNTYKFFYTWLNTVFGFGTGLYENGVFVGARNNASFLTNYKNEYSTDVHVLVYDNTGELQNTYVFQEAFPMSISDPSLSWRDNNNLYRFDVTLAYTSWTMNNRAAS